MNEQQFKSILTEALAEQTRSFDEKLTKQSSQFDAKLEAQESRLDAKFEKQTQDIESRLETRIDQQMTTFFTKMTNHVDGQIGELRSEMTSLKADINHIIDVVDGIAHRLDADEQERAAVVAHNDRQDGWIGQLARNTNTKLIPEQ